MKHRIAAPLITAAVLCLLMPPPKASAIQLRWASGATNLEFSGATRCTLAVQASDQEGRIPRDWRLLFLANTSAIAPIPITGPDSCGLGFAQLATLAAPADSFETSANQLTARFCSLGSGHVYIARYILDLPGGSHGKFKVVALDPADAASERVIQSEEATFNGGLAGTFPPVILRAVAEHQSTTYDLRLIGAGLEQTQSATLNAADGSWDVPLTLLSLSSTEIHASASLAAWVPDSRVILQTLDGRVAAEPIPADPPPPPLDPQAACHDQFIEDVDPPAVIQPKDFALVPGGWNANGSWTFHLFYIRQNQRLRLTQGCSQAECTEKMLGHSVSNDLHQWTVLDTAAIVVRPGRWDSFHVWAPSIVRKGVRYYMYYTGVDGTGQQRIGVATSTDLSTWTQGDSVLTVTTAGLWVDQTKRDLRDPFVMENPDVPGEWLMYFTAQTTEYPGMAAGFVRSSDVAFSSGTIRTGGALWRTQQNRQSGLESPHVFQYSGKWWMFFTKPVSAQDTIYVLSTTTSPTDTVTAHWSPIQRLADVVAPGASTAYTFWHGTEYLKLAGTGGGKEYLAGFSDADQSISYTQMRPLQSPLMFAGDCPDALGVGDPPKRLGQPELRLLNAMPGQRSVTLEIFLPTRESGSVAIHDVLGRKLKVLTTGAIVAGLSRWVWDGTDDLSNQVPSGVYFATLTYADRRFAKRLAFVR